jgi:MFS family permease
MLTLLLLAPPLGVVIGYLMTATLITHLTWHWAFYSQAILALVPTVLFLCLTKNRFFDIETAVEKKAEEVQDNEWLNN